MSYGVPYQGSKNRIAKDIIAKLPTGKRFVDLFAGGCAMTHCALLSGKWERVLCNDKYPIRGQEVFRQACEGEFNKPEYFRIVSKEEFMRRRFIDGWMIDVWGWNGLTRYIGTPFESFCRNNNITDIRQLETTKQKYPLYSLRRLQRLAGIDLSTADFTQMDYRKYEYREGDVIYADPPYEGVGNYQKTDNFDHDAFWKWVRTRDYPVYVSEYKAPSDFTSIWNKKKGRMVSPDDHNPNKKTVSIEHLYIHNSKLNSERK